MPSSQRKYQRAPKFTGPRHCTDCRQRIEYVVMTATGKLVPIDPIAVDDGNVCGRRSTDGKLWGYVISAEHPPQPGWRRWAAHFGTCPDRNRPEPRPAPEPPPTLFD